MLSWIILILVIAIVCLLGLMWSSYIFGRSELKPPMDDSVDVIAANRQRLAERDYGNIQIEVVKRGYRMDQVDALVEQLTAQLEAGDSGLGTRDQPGYLAMGPAGLGVESDGAREPSAPQASKGERDLWQQ